MKVKIKTKRSAEGDNYSLEMDGIFHDGKLQFFEEGTSVLLDFKSHQMMRKDSEKMISYQFVENEKTVNKLSLYGYGTVDVDIFTKKYFYENSVFEVLYTLDSGIDVWYQVCWEMKS